MNDEPTASKSAPPTPSPTPAGKRSRTIPIVIGALLLGLTVATALVWVLMQRPGAAPSSGTTVLQQPNVRLDLFATGLANPTSIVASGVSGDDRLFVLDQSGKVRIVKADGTVVNEPFLDLGSKVQFAGEAGLLGMAFSPDYARDGYVYLNYVDPDLNTVIARYHVSSDANKADASSGQVVLTQKQPYQNHNGGAIAFGKDGYMYIAFGDGGSAGDPEKRGQDKTTWLGKILRIDVSSLPYKVPADNPFVGQSGVKPEIWDLGLRNPWRISFDTKTHELYIADVGQGDVEEINVEAPGAGGINYGWRCFEGKNEFKTDGCGDKSTYAFPQLTYDHTEGRCSVTGGYVYRGSAYPNMTGKYFYGDYCGGQVYYIEHGDDGYTTGKALQTSYGISTFGQDTKGELYLADYKTGALYRLKDAK